MQNRVFLFDMDGVLIDTERTWEKYGGDFLINLLGKDIADKVGSTLGLNVNDVYRIALENGFAMDKDEYLKIYDEQAKFIYSKSSLTLGMDELVKELHNLEFKIGLVSASRRSWIDEVLPRLSFGDSFEHIISINDRPDLRNKPHPDGYIEAIRVLKGAPDVSMVLEDSNPGIQAGKSAGAYTIGFRKNLLPAYEQEGADVYADEVEDVIRIVKLSTKKE
ncbi:MAG TPA: HAD family phosphatase [Candidatus Paceibacterota bacterium]